MSSKTIYTCDRCGGTQETRDQFWGIRVQITHFGCYPQNWDTVGAAHPAVEVCRSCLEHLGFYPRPETKAKPDYNPPSTEDLIREILSRVGVEAS